MVAVPLSPSDHQNATISTPKTSKDSFPSPSSSSSPSPTSLLHRSHSRSRSHSTSKYLTTTTTTTRSLSVSFQGESFFFQSTKPKPSQSENSRWPPARPFSSVRLLVLDDADASSEADSHSSGSNSDKGAGPNPAPARPTPRGISVPARFWQETNSRLRRLPEPSTPLPPKKPFLTSKNAMSPLMVRSNGNAPSIISFAAQVRKGKKGEGRIEEAHLLRLLHNRLLQWRCVNARANAALSARRLAVEVSI